MENDASESPSMNEGSDGSDGAGYPDGKTHHSVRFWFRALRATPDFNMCFEGGIFKKRIEPQLRNRVVFGLLMLQSDTGWTNEEFAQVVGVTEATIRNWRRKHLEMLNNLDAGRVEELRSFLDLAKSNGLALREEDSNGKEDNHYDDVYLVEIDPLNNGNDAAEKPKVERKIGFFNSGSFADVEGVENYEMIMHAMKEFESGKEKEAITYTPEAKDGEGEVILTPFMKQQLESAERIQRYLSDSQTYAIVLWGHISKAKKTVIEDALFGLTKEDLDNGTKWNPKTPGKMRFTKYSLTANMKKKAHNSTINSSTPSPMKRPRLLTNNNEGEKKKTETRQYAPKIFSIRNKNYRPGMISDELKAALGLRSGERPPYISRILQFGYPPGHTEKKTFIKNGVQTIKTIRKASYPGVPYNHPIFPIPPAPPVPVERNVPFTLPPDPPPATQTSTTITNQKLSTLAQSPPSKPPLSNNLRSTSPPLTPTPLAPQNSTPPPPPSTPPPPPPPLPSKPPLSNNQSRPYLPPLSTPAQLSQNHTLRPQGQAPFFHSLQQRNRVPYVPAWPMQYMYPHGGYPYHFNN